MKKRVIAAIMGVMLIGGSLTTEAKTRTAIGYYYDYMTIVTTDGNEWLLSDAQKKSNPYMVRRTVYKTVKGKRVKSCEYMPIFKNGQKVRVTFDTCGTRWKRDDRIIKVKAVKT